MNISCSSIRKETRVEQITRSATSQSASSEEKQTPHDSSSSPIPQKDISTVNDSLTGILNVIGNEPFTKLGLQDSNGTMYILKCTKEMESELRTKQGKKVSVYYRDREQIPEGQALKVVKFEFFQQPHVK